jgi:hypothetical protein
MMRPKFVFVCVLVIMFFALAAAPGVASDRDEVKWKIELVPCVLVGEDDAGGEAEFESESGAESGLLKVEIWGATLYRGETLAIEVDGQRAGTLTLDERGSGSGSFTDLVVEESDVDVFGEDVEILSSDCERG